MTSQENNKYKKQRRGRNGKHVLSYHHLSIIHAWHTLLNLFSGQIKFQKIEVGKPSIHEGPLKLKV
jgi:hypothetical protein